MKKRLSLVLVITALSAALQGKEPEIWNFQFPEGEWELAHSRHSGNQTIQEYIPKGEKLSHWSAMVTSFSSVGSVGLEDWLGLTQRQLAAGCGTLRFQVLTKTETEIIAEWSHDGCQGYPAQHQLQKFTKTDREMMALSYVVSGRQMSANERKAWLDMITNAKREKCSVPKKSDLTSAASEAERSRWAVTERADSPSSPGLPQRQNPDGRGNRQVPKPEPSAAIPPDFSPYLTKVGAAAGKALKEVSSATEFYVCDVTENGGSIKSALRFLREARAAKAAVAFASPQLGATEKLLRGVCVESKDESFEGVTIIIVGPKKSPEMFDGLLGKKGFFVLHAQYEISD